MGPQHILPSRGGWKLEGDMAVADAYYRHRSSDPPNLLQGTYSVGILPADQRCIREAIDISVASGAKDGNT